MAVFDLNDHRTGLRIRTITGDSFSRAVEAEAKAGRTLANADLTLLGRYGEPTALNFQGGTFTAAKLNGANLTGANFRLADLSNAQLRATVQTATLWTGATLTGIDEKNAQTEKRSDR